MPVLQQQLQQVEQRAATRRLNVQDAWEALDPDAEEYRQALTDVLKQQGAWQQRATTLHHELAAAESWVERQSIALGTEKTQVEALLQQLQAKYQANEAVIATATEPELTELRANQAHLERSVRLVNNKASLLNAQQASLTQQRSLLAAQNEVLLAEQKLIDAYIASPDADTEGLRQQLLETRAVLADMQRLAEEAEANSAVLTAPLQKLQADLLAQNDEHIQAAREQQAILSTLLQTTERNGNLALEAARAQRELNNLESQIIERLQDATVAGSEAAKRLLDVAKYNDLSAATEIYLRDYSDLAGDRGRKGVGTAEDQQLADHYRQEVARYQALEAEARSQAAAVNQAKQAATNQLVTLEAQQKAAFERLNALNAQLTTTAEEREAKQQELDVTQAKVDALERVRQQTEQTFTQLVRLEQLNLAQAQLERQIAEQRYADIDAAVVARQERDRQVLERQRLDIQYQIEQLKQQQANEELRQTLNQIRADLGESAIAGNPDPHLTAQLAALQSTLQALETQQPELPSEVQALLAEVKGDVELALAGGETDAIQENLLSAVNVLIGQVEQYKQEIARLDAEEARDQQILALADGNLQEASRLLLEEVKRSQFLDAEREVINPLYLEVMTKVAYAEHAVEVSEELEKSVKQALEESIKQRIEQRKARKKSFWNKILSTVSTVLGVLGSVITVLGGPLAPLGIAIAAASAGVNAIMAAMNGDWMGAIFSAVMGGVNAITGGLASAGTITKSALQGIRTIQSLATGAFQGARSLMNGDSILGFLQIVGTLATAATTQMQGWIDRCAGPMKRFLYQTVNSLKDVPVKIYKAVEAIKDNHWFDGINGIVNVVSTLGKNFGNAFNSPLEDFFGGLDSVRKGIEKWVKTGEAIYGAIKKSDLMGWLNGFAETFDIWKEDISGFVKNVANPPKYQNFTPGNYNESHSRLQRVDEILYDRQARGYEFDKGISTQFSVNGHDYLIRDKINNPHTGLDAFLLRDQTTGENLIVFRGSEFVGKGWQESWNDIWADLNYRGIGHNQLSNDANHIRQWMTENENIIVTGHSLGGGVAQFAALQFPGNVSEVITFNAPGLSSHQLTKTDYEHFKVNNSHIKATHYSVEGDIVSMAGNRFLPGDVYLMRQPKTAPYSEHGLNYGGDNGQNLVGRVGNPEIQFRVLSSDQVNNPEFSYPVNITKQGVTNALLFPMKYTFLRDRQTTEFSRSMLGVVSGSGWLHSTP